MRMKRIAPLVAGLALLLVSACLLGLQSRPAAVAGPALSAPPAPVAPAPAPTPDATVAAAGEAAVAAGPAREDASSGGGKLRLSMIAVGDLMTDRNVGKAIAANGYRSILERVRDLTRDADVSFANLECPLSSSGPHDPSNCSFRARPETVKVVTDGGFDIVSLANNHSLNAGREAILQTLDVLDKEQVKYCGAWRDRSATCAPTYLQAGEGPVRLAFIAATDLSFGHGSYNKVAPDRSNLLAQIRAARQQADLVVVSVHWGDEYQSLPNQRQRNTAHAAVNAGADLVLGHHPHTLQGVEIYRGKPVLYSMGNFVFDQREGERMESAIFHLDYARGWGWQIFAKPIWIPRARMGPIFPEAARRDRILARLQKISRALGTTTLEVKNGKAWLRVPEGAAGAAARKGNT